MSDTIIKVENLGKKYILGHQTEGRSNYVALRDVITDSAKSLVKRFQNPKSKVQKNREEFWALKDVSFEVKQGEVIGIIGRNGAGKSTLLKILSRITEPTTGRIEIGGRVASLLEVGTGFHPELTGRENIYLNGAILGMSREEIQRKFDEIVAFAEVEKFLDTPVKRYSSGMYVRLAFAVAAHLEPEILVVDEVLAVGDAAFQKKCLGKMGDVATQEGRTVLFVSHNMTTITGLCQYTVLLKQGQIANYGKTKEVVNEYIESIQKDILESSLTQYIKRSGNGSIKVTKVILGTKKDSVCGYWITGEDVFIEIEYECAEDKVYRNIEIALAIHRLDTSPLLYIGTKIVKQDIENLEKIGTSICYIPNLPIEPGKYLLYTEIKHNGIIVDLVEGASIINVEEGDFYKTGSIWPYGGFLCHYQWEHKLIDHALKL